MTPDINDPKGRRKRKRIHFITEIVINHGGQITVYKRTHDISMNGVFVSTAKPLPLGSEGDFSLILSVGMRREQINGRFIVARVISMDEGLSEPEQGPGMGLKFTGIDPDASELLYNLVLYNQPD
ncbi:MAG: PilZ domain-containing protein [Nitrospinae bacterium]|nr:PilZ domain-containing protein [Nitrospinota bacterium]